MADPVRLRIPSIGVDAPIDPVEVEENNVLQVPDDAQETGWGRDGYEPGQPGPSVIVGHVDSYQGPGVLLRLAELETGDEVVVDRADASSVTFVVGHLEQHSKDTFPNEAVYGPTPGPELRLITCGGEFDWDERNYRDNIIVYAAEAG